MLELKQKNQLNAAQLSCFANPRPKYELFNLEEDPGEINNLANDTIYNSTLERLISVLDQWSVETNDFMPSVRTPDEFDRETAKPDHTVRKRPRPDKKDMFGTYGSY